MGTSKCEYGYTGRIARVDLTTGRVFEIETSNYSEQYIGGRGMAERVFWDEGNFDVGPLDPQSVFVLMTSPLAGTLASAASQGALCAKAATLPNEYVTTSLCGGGWSAELKRAGFDGLVVSGKAPEPSYLLVNDGIIEVKRAPLRQLWGADTAASREELWRRHGKRACVLTIGPAGEQMCRDGMIITDDCHTFGTNGFGAVWGSKNLKAVVISGTGDITVANPEALIADVERARKLITKKETEEGPCNTSRLMPKWAHVHFGWPEPDLIKDGRAGEVDLGYSACLNCPISCGWSYRYKDGSGAGTTHCEEVLVYSAPTAQRHGLGDQNRYSLECNNLVQRMGFNEFMFEDHNVLYRLIDAGILTEEYTGLDFSKMGEIELFYELVEKVVSREPGFGDDLAEGWYHVCEKLGPEALKTYDACLNSETGCKDFQMIPGWDMKGTLPGNVITSMGIRRQNSISNYLYYSVQLDPSISHNEELRREVIGNVSRKFMGDPEIGLNPDDPQYAAVGAKFTMEQNTLLDTLSMCGFVFPATYSNYTEDHTGELFSAAFFNDVTGNDATEEEMSLLVADRIINLERLISWRGGHTVDHPHAGTLVENGGHYKREDIERGQRELYELMGWDAESGMPTADALRALGMEKELADMERLGYDVPKG